MPCMSPIFIKIPERTGRTPVPCGRCVACLQSRRGDWTFRLMEEERRSVKSTFLTLTYQDKFLPMVKGEPSLKLADLQSYFKRVRKYSPQLKYFAVGEYGEKYQRPHYHAIVFNTSDEILQDKWTKNDEPIGIVTTDKVSQASIHYVTKYILNSKSGWGYKKTKPFSTMSNALGKEYVPLNADKHRETMSDQVVYVGGTRQRMPRYYKTLIFNAEQSKILAFRNTEKAIQKLESTDYDDHLEHLKYLREMGRRNSKSNFL